MDPGLRKGIQIILLIGVILAAGRVGYIFYQRHQDNQPRPAKISYPQQADDYVRPPKIYAYDLESAKKELVGKTVWVRIGNILPYYRYSSATRTADLAQKVGVLPPLEKLEIKDVILQRAPVAPVPGQVVVVSKQILAVFQKADDPGNFAVSVGKSTGDDYNFNANDRLFFADPHDLYKHWPADVWAAIDQHQVKKGMNELQVGLALGEVVGASSGDYGDRWLQYRDDGKLVKVTFAKNQATEIATGEDATRP
jgi:hypothetical protein